VCDADGSLRRKDLSSAWVTSVEVLFSITYQLGLGLGLGLFNNNSVSDLLKQGLKHVRGVVVMLRDSAFSFSFLCLYRGESGLHLKILCRFNFCGLNYDYLYIHS